MRVPLGSDRCFPADLVDKAETLEGTNTSCNCLLVSSGDDLLNGEVEDGYEGEGEEGEPVDLLQQGGVLLASNHQASISESYEDNPPDETEEEGIEVGCYTHISGDPEQLTPPGLRKVQRKVLKSKEPISARFLLENESVQNIYLYKI